MRRHVSTCAWASVFLPRCARSSITLACAGQPLVNVELHGIDVLDAADGLEGLRPHQPDVRVPRDEKMRALRAIVDELRNLGHEFVTLKDAAGRVGA